MEPGLGNQAMLAKIDKLRELNVGSMVPLPQLVVVGDQSSGKSSVLESLTGFSFPRAPGLCTRYATQITCCRDPLKSISISIIPRPEANEELKSKLLDFQRRVDDLDDEKLAMVFEEANATMGIRMGTDDEDSGCGAFSEDILKIEIYGPEQNHLTIIDVPGIFRVPTPGLTTETDIILVENMVKRYMNNSRTIILAVMPCNVDVATQEIVKLAEKADPNGTRTMGVLTKPDLATENATRGAVVDLVGGKRSNLRLGYYVVKNRSADDNASTLSQRAAAEKAFFMAPPWLKISGRCGVSALKDRLRQLLMSISKQELPNVKAEIEQRMRRCKANLDNMGPARSDESSQRQHLGKLANRFQIVTHAALNGYYAGEAIFKTHPHLKLITRIMKLHSVFSNVFGQRAHMQHFDSAEGDELQHWPRKEDTTIPFEIPLNKYRELDDIIQTEEYECPMPEDKPIMDRIKEIYHSSRGPDLGTFGGTVLSTVFQEQSEKWEALSLFHVSNAIALVHDYIFQLLCRQCPEKQILDQLWNGFLVDRLSELYRKAMEHARFLLAIERGRPITFNHYFNDILQKKRAGRLAKSMQKSSITLKNAADDRYVSIDCLRNAVSDKDNEQQLCEDIFDIFVSYYKVARKRFVDVVYQQVISHFLLNGDESPVKVFGPEMIMKLDSEQLELIAGEDEESKQQRTVLNREVASLKEALKVLRA